MAQIRSIAVLPLDNLSHDPEQEYFADGLTEALISNLSKIGALRVISRTSVMQYKATRKPLPEIARELRVDAVVEGSVQRSANQVRITAQLIDGKTEAHLWSRSFDRDLSDVLALESDMAQASVCACLCRNCGFLHPPGKQWQDASQQGQSRNANGGNESRDD